MVTFIPVVQLSFIKSAVQIDQPSVCRHVPLLQLGEHSREQLVPKYPSLQARGRDANINKITKFGIKQRHCKHTCCGFFFY